MNFIKRWYKTRRLKREMDGEIREAIAASFYGELDEPLEAAKNGIKAKYLELGLTQQEVDTVCSSITSVRCAG